MIRARGRCVRSLLSLQQLVTSPPRGVRSIVMSMSVCLSVCPLAQAQLENHTAELQEFCVLPIYLWPWLDLLLVQLRNIVHRFRFYGSEGHVFETDTARHMYFSAAIGH